MEIETTETSTRNKSLDSLLVENSRCIQTPNKNETLPSITTNQSNQTETYSTSVHNPKASTNRHLTISSDSPCNDAELKRLQESELTSKRYKKSPEYMPLKPLEESPDSSWGEAAQLKLIESELKGKIYRQPPCEKDNVPEEYKPMIQNEPAKAKINNDILEDTIKFKNIGFVNNKLTEIVVENEEECESITTEEVKRAIIQLTQREKHNPIYNYTEKYIRAKHKTYVPVEVCKDRNGRMIYTPLKSLNKPEISFGAEIRSPQLDEKEKIGSTSDDELTEVEYPTCKRCNKKVSFPDTKIRVSIEVMGSNGRRTRSADKQHISYYSALTKQQIIDLINEEIKLDIDQQINLVDIIDQATLSVKTSNAEIQDDWETKAEEIRSELKKICIEIESKGLAECRQTDITSHRIEMTDTKPIRHKVRPVPYQSRKEFEQIIKDQLAAGII